MASNMQFLVVEDDADGEFLLGRSLLRRYPRANVCVFPDANEALAAAKSQTWTGFIVHRALDLDGIEMIKRLRSSDRAVPIVMVSGRDQRAAALAAGANAFLHYAEWPRLASCFAAESEPLP
jgi:DNA-binding response OmpR family regulator